MEYLKFSCILNLVLDFAANNELILAVGLCGSWARGNPGPQSDIDLSIITTDKESFKNTPWLDKIDFRIINDKVIRFEDRKYGRVWSRHVFLKSGAEIEFSFADRSWSDVEPIDAGTKEVVTNGYKILYDPNQILAELVDQLNTNS